MGKEKATEYFIDSFERKINKEVPKSIRKRKGSKKSIWKNKIQKHDKNRQINDKIYFFLRY